MTRTPSPLAWWFFGLSESPPGDDAIGLAALLAAEALGVLGRHELLWPDRVEDVAIVAGDEATLASALRELDAPSAVIHGTGVVYDENGAGRQVPDPVTLKVFARVDVGVQVATELDVWLPYDVRAAPQRAVSERNRPRLRAALEDLARLGVAVSTSEATRYAVVDGLHVRNHTNAFGQPTQVV